MTPLTADQKQLLLDLREEQASASGGRRTIQDQRTLNELLLLGYVGIGLTESGRTALQEAIRPGPPEADSRWGV